MLILINFTRNESNKILLGYILTYILKIKYKLKVNSIKKLNGTIKMNKREHNWTSYKLLGNYNKIINLPNG